MVGLFVRLKLRLLRNGLRGGWGRVAGLVIGGIFSIPLAMAGFAVLAAARSARADRPAIAVLTYAGLFLGWMCLPVLGFGSDETLDPSRLALFPIRPRHLMTGLLAASAVGIAPLATLLALTGSVVGYGPANAGIIVVVIAPLVELALCLTASRALITALARLLRSRRGRDVTLVLITLVAILPQLVRVWLLPGSGQVTSIDLAPATAVLRWTPPGLAGQAMADAARGRLALAAGELALAALALVPLLAWWSRSLARAMTTAEATATGRSRRREAGSAGAGAPLFPRLLRFLPANRIGAVAAREMRYISRDPRRRVQLLSGLLVPMFGFIPLLANGQLEDHRAVLGAAFVAFFLGLTSLNQLGVDGRAYWVNVSAGNDPRSDLIGKNVAAALWTVPVITIAACGLAALSGGWLWVPLAVTVGIGILGVQLGVGNYVSVRVPTPLPESTTNPWAQNSGQGCASGFVGLLALAAEGALLLPVLAVVALGAFAWRPALFIAGPFAIAYGAVVWRIGLAQATRWLWWRLPELLTALTPP